MSQQPIDFLEPHTRRRVEEGTVPEFDDPADELHKYLRECCTQCDFYIQIYQSGPHRHGGSPVMMEWPYSYPLQAQHYVDHHPELIDIDYSEGTFCASYKVSPAWVRKENSEITD